MSPFFWRNPELARHARAKLRRPRVVGLALLVVVVHAIVLLSVWNNVGGDSGGFFRYAYLWALAVEGATFLLWCALACGRAVPAERQARTYDFLRVTRLSPRELMLGKVFGEPIVAYFFLACSLPFGAAAGLLAGFSPRVVLETYALLVALGVFVGLLGLFASMFLERGAGGAAALFLVVQLQSFTALAPNRPLSGFAAVSVIPAVLDLHGFGFDVHPTLFGFGIPFYATSLLLLAVFGGLVALAIERNLKRDLDRMVVYGRRQILGIVALLNGLFYSLIDPASVGSALAPAQIAGTAVGFNAVLFFLSALGMVTPKETLKVWSRRYVASQERYVSEVGPPWPWLVLVGGLAYGALLIEVFFLRRRVPIGEWPLAATAIEVLALLAFAIRDLLFLQWCRLTRIRRAMTTGVLLLCLVYAATAVFAAAAWWRSPTLFAVLLALTPFPALQAATFGQPPGAAVWIGATLQLVPAALILRSISNRLKRPLAPKS